jgi:transcription-repair coupling factor (superfamily II helicase)
VSTATQDTRALPVWGAPEGWDAFLLARRRREFPGAIVHVTRDDARMARLAEALAFAMPETEILRFPAWDCLPYDRVSPAPALISERIATLARLLEPPKGPRIVLTTVNALVQRVPPRSAFAGAGLDLSVNGTVHPEELAAFLEAHGYGRAGTVMEPGEYAVRGGIIDIFPAGEADPVRLDLFGDTIESIRVFDPATQRSGARRQALSLRPVSEVPLDPASVSRFRTAWRELFGPEAAQDPLYLSVSDGRRHAGMEHWVALFHPTMENLLDYLPDASVSLDHQADEVLSARLEMIADHYTARKSVPRDGEVPYRPLPPDRLYLDRDGWDEMLSFGPLLAFSPFGMPDGATGIDGGGRPGPVFAQSGGGPGLNVFDQLRGQTERWRTEGRRVVVAAWTRGSRERIANLLREHGFKDFAAEEDFAAVSRKPAGSVSLVTLGVERGFVAERLALVGEQDLLGERISRPPRRRKRADQFIAEATEIAEGDYVVHQEYGIGRYDGLATLHVTGAPHDCLRLIYDGDEKLFLPVENIEVLSRFGSETQGVALDKLGGVGWQTRKARMKARIRDMAGELIRIAAARKIRDAAIMAPGEGAWDEFCARFPFAETEDQSRAIADVLEDLASGRPMDRLICGDVGFGKTEVALRAAFVAAMSGTQVAVVVPTTLLARQHFRTFRDRFAGLPLKVEQLSRLVGPKQATQTKKDLAEGKIDIIVGTHALLAKSIAFKQLGLLIIDEEQHFGVTQKERLKQLKANVHVLTLTATPIPRTLQLALAGVREMSVIATPPVDRLAVRTFVLPYDPVVVREAVLRELHRGGQCFYVAPRITDLDEVQAQLKELVPEAKIIVAHGQMTPTRLEEVMTAFDAREFDVLLSTNIIESGLDIPSANTMIVHRADMFGLAQLYQLRGRIGRSKVRGYAYLTLPAGKMLTETAQRRLEVMQTLDTLGAGFTLASHDLDIRGAGNLLGQEQSGHVREVGIELYQHMLEEAVAAARSGDPALGETKDEWTPQITIGTPVLIPETYVADLPVRLGLYRRIVQLVDRREIDAFAAELVDRFGPLPPEVDNLLDIIAIKRFCRDAGVEKVDAGEKGASITFRGNRFANPAGLVDFLQQNAATAKLRPDQKLVIMRNWEDTRERLKGVTGILGHLARIASATPAAAPAMARAK